MLVNKNSIIDVQDRITVRGNKDQLGGFAVSTRITGLTDNDRLAITSLRGLYGMAAGDGFLAVTQRRPSDQKPFVYLYKVNDSSSIVSGKLTELSGLQHVGNGGSDQFGISKKSIAIANGLLFIGDPQATVDGTQCGRVNVWSLTSGSPQYKFTIEPPAGYLSEGSNFGYSIDVGNGKVVIGAPNWGGTRSDGIIANDIGAAFVFNTIGDFLFPLLPSEYYSPTAPTTTVTGTASVKETVTGETYQYVRHTVSGVAYYNALSELQSYSTPSVLTYNNEDLEGIPSTYSGPLEGAFPGTTLDGTYTVTNGSVYASNHPKFYVRYWPRRTDSRIYINNGDYYLTGDIHRDNSYPPDNSGYTAYGNVTINLDQGGTYRFEHWDNFGAGYSGNPPRILQLWRRYPGEDSFTRIYYFEGYADSLSLIANSETTDFVLTGSAEIQVIFQHGHTGNYSNISFRIYNPNTNGRTQSTLLNLPGGQYGYDVSVGGGRIVVGSPGNNKVSIYDLDGELKKTITASSLGLGSVGFGKSVASGCGRIAVASRSITATRLHVFDANGNSAGESGSSAFSATGVSSGDNRSSDPVVRIQDNRIYASMINRERVRVYNIDRQNIYDGSAEMSVSDAVTPGYSRPGGYQIDSNDIYNFAVYKNYVFAGLPLVETFSGQVFAYYSTSDELNNPQQHIMDLFEDQPGGIPE